MYTHSGPITRGIVAFTATQIGTSYGETCGKDGSDIPSWFQFEKLEKTTSAHMDSSVPKKKLIHQSQKKFLNLSSPYPVDPAMQLSIQEPTKEGKRKRKAHTAMNSSSRDTPGGKRKRERERGEEEEKTRRQTTLPAMHLASKDTPRRGGNGVAAEVHELVVVEIHSLHYTPGVNGSDLCHPLSEDCCCQ